MNGSPLSRRHSAARRLSSSLLAALAAGSLACVGSPPDPPGLSAEQAAFWANLQPLCGNAYAGQLVDATLSDTTLMRAPLIVHVMECSDSVMRMPFQVGEDRSQIWVLSKTGVGLQLKHDHRSEDGIQRAITHYGGHTFAPGTPLRQQFLADSATAAMMPMAARNIWTLAIVPGDVFVYGLRRLGTGQRIRVEFDLTQPLETPPPPPRYAP